MKKELYSACWALQDPAFNYFKMFLKINKEHLNIAGIIYPEKITDAIEGMDIFDFKETLKKIPPSTPLLDCTYADSNYSGALLIREKIKFFSRRYKYPLVSIAEVLDTLLQDDVRNILQWPIQGVSSSDLRALKTFSAPELLKSHFLDGKSYHIASELDHILRTAEWERMLAFDQDEISEQALQETLHLVHQVRSPQVFRIISAPIYFLHALLQFQQSHRDFQIHLHQDLWNSMSSHQKNFFSQCFMDRLRIEEKYMPSTDLRVAYLSASAEEIIKIIKNKHLPSAAIFGMPRSVLDYHDLTAALGTQDHKISLRQPDTQFKNLLASLLT